MKIALIGYGKMGHQIESILKERGHDVVLIIDKDNQDQFNRESMAEVDVAIEFSTPSAAYDNIIRCMDCGVAVVCGTTAWLDRFDDVVAYSKSKNGAFFYASNYSIGVNIFMEINRKLAAFMDHYSHYDVTMEEEHHTAKLDYPSGTSITLAQDIIANTQRKMSWSSTPTADTAQVDIASIRRSNIPGTHTVTWEAEEDLIAITHRAKSRRGFAMGAVIAAEFMCGKKGVYSMNDILKFV